MRPCLERGCPRLVVRGRCAEHTQQRAAQKEASSPHRWVYRDRRWFRCRRARLDRCGNQCEIVEHGRRCTETDRPGARLHGHHHPRRLRDLLRLELDPFDPDAIVMACGRHHGQLTRLEQNAGTE